MLWHKWEIHVVCRAIIGLAMDRESGRPAVFNVGIKPFPWPAFTLDYGAAAASTAFNFLLVFAFLVPTRSMVSTIVREKELRLREGMRIFGLKVSRSLHRSIITAVVSKEMRLKQGMFIFGLKVSNLCVIRGYWYGMVWKEMRFRGGIMSLPWWTSHCGNILVPLKYIKYSK